MKWMYIVMLAKLFYRYVIILISNFKIDDIFDSEALVSEVSSSMTTKTA